MQKLDVTGRTDLGVIATLWTVSEVDGYTDEQRRLIFDDAVEAGYDWVAAYMALVMERIQELKVILQVADSS